MSIRRSLIAGFAALSLVAAGAAGVWAQGEWKAPASEKGKKNPEKGPAAVAMGQKSAQTNCVSCHGPLGKGDGPAAAALTPKPANWTSAKVQAETDGELFWKISNGRGPMPPWKHLPDKERWSLVAFIRSLKGK